MMRLVISNNPISTKSAISLSQVLISNQTLIKLNLSQCSIDKNGGIAIANMLKFNKNIKELFLKGN